MGRGARRRWAPGPRRGVWRPEADNPGPLKPARAPGRQWGAPNPMAEPTTAPSGGPHPHLTRARGRNSRARERNTPSKNRGPALVAAAAKGGGQRPLSPTAEPADL